jgi:AcrR family transcriptional regulator
MTPFHLATVLTERSEQRRKIPKRTRTRYSILAATAREMEKVGYDGLTIDNIVDEARLARGTFYLYFTNRSDVAAAVIRTYRALVLARRPRGGRELKAYDAILRMNKYYVATYAWNAPLLAGIETLVRNRPDQACSRDFWNNRWGLAVLSDANRRSGAGTGSCDKRGLLAVRAVLAMADEFLREAFVYKSPTLTRLINNQENNQENDLEVVAEVLSVVWYRSIYGSHPKGVEQILPLF